MIKHRKPTVKLTASRAKQIWHRDIVRELRAKILDGTFTSGQQLPTYVELEKQFRSTPRTVSRALEVLQEHGFVRTEKRRGMFVAENLPHESHYALVFGTKREQLSQFFLSLRNEAERCEASGRRRFSMFYDIAGHTDTDDYQRLQGLIQSHRIAGVIFAQAFHHLEGQRVLEEPGIPRVALASGSARPDIPVVSAGVGTFLPRALDALAARGRNRVAMIRKSDDDPWPPLEVREFLAEVSSRGMTTRQCWIQSVHQTTTVRANEVAQLLMFAPPEMRPDALIIRDDNLVEHATAGLVAAGVRVPQDLDVVAHANFPWVSPSAIPEVRRLGYDTRQMFDVCIERIDALRRGQPVERVTHLPAIFEDELTSDRSSSKLIYPTGFRA
jgi:DNA-binding LacI/PurR family transcriptional regulator